MKPLHNDDRLVRYTAPNRNGNLANADKPSHEKMVILGDQVFIGDPRSQMLLGLSIPHALKMSPTLNLPEELAAQVTAAAEQHEPAKNHTRILVEGNDVFVAGIHGGDVLAKYVGEHDVIFLEDRFSGV